MRSLFKSFSEAFFRRIILISFLIYSYPVFAISPSCYTHLLGPLKAHEGETYRYNSKLISIELLVHAIKTKRIAFTFEENVDVHELTKKHHVRSFYSEEKSVPNSTRITQEIIDSLNKEDLSRPGILMKKKTGGFEIIDGNHRAQLKAKNNERMNFFIISEEDVIKFFSLYD